MYVSRETPDVTTTPKCYDSASILVRDVDTQVLTKIGGNTESGLLGMAVGARALAEHSE